MNGKIIGKLFYQRMNFTQDLAIVEIANNPNLLNKVIPNLINYELMSILIKNHPEYLEELNNELNNSNNFNNPGESNSSDKEVQKNITINNSKQINVN